MASNKTVKPASVTQETIHHIPESVLINPVLLAQYAISAGLMAQMVWLMWGLKWTKGLIAHVCENLPFDFVARSKEFTDYMLTYANPFDVGAYEPKKQRNTAKPAKPAESPKTADSSMSLDDYLKTEYKLNESAVYAVLAALSADNLSTYGATMDYAQETYNNKHVKESASNRKRMLESIRLAIKGEYKNRKDYAAYVNEDSTEESDNGKAESVPTAQTAINQTDLQAMIAGLVSNAIAEAMKGLKTN